MSTLHIYTRDRGPGHLRRLLRLVGLMSVLVAVGIRQRHAPRMSRLDSARPRSVSRVTAWVATLRPRPSPPWLASRHSIPIISFSCFGGRQRDDPQMSPLAASLSDADMQDIAATMPRRRRCREVPAIQQSPRWGQKLVQAHHSDSCPRQG